MKHNLAFDGKFIVESPPSRGRGLKRRDVEIVAAAMGSPPSRGRGLKRLVLYSRSDAPFVAPFTGAWIEIE